MIRCSRCRKETKKEEWKIVNLRDDVTLQVSATGLVCPCCRALHDKIHGPYPEFVTKVEG